MPDQVPFPIGLLRRMNSSVVDDDELALLDSWIQSDDQLQPSEEIMRRVRRIAWEDRPTPLRRLIASLIRGGSLPVAAGVRSAGRNQSLLYVAGDTEIEIELTGSGSRPRAVAGQVRGEGDWQSARLLDPHGNSIRSDIDEFGLFAFPPVSQPGLVVVRGASAEVYLRLPAEDDSEH